MNCEICGRDSDIMYVVIFLGSRTYACPNCVDEKKLTIVKKMGVSNKTSVSPKDDKGVVKIKSVRKRSLNLAPDFELVDGYGFLIKKRREEIGMTQEELAKRLKVKLSYIKKIESNKLVPEYNVIRKLEKLLNIKLVNNLDSDVEGVEYIVGDELDSGPTIGDLLFSGYEDEGEQK